MRTKSIRRIVLLQYSFKYTKKYVHCSFESYLGSRIPPSRTLSGGYASIILASDESMVADFDVAGSGRYRGSLS